MPEKIPSEQSEMENKSIRSHYIDLPKSQKIAVAVLAFFAVVIMFVWVAQTRSNIFSPLAYPDKASDTGQDNGASCADGSCQNDLQAELETEDTDGDGLNDWEELSVYKTSPYLADSDSDGYTDKEEIDTGNDPVCAEGTTCESTTGGQSVGEDQAGGQSLTPVLPGINSTSTSDQELILQQILAGQADPAVLRQLLVEAGMDSRILEQISDEDLLGSYEKVLGGE